MSFNYKHNILKTLKETLKDILSEMEQQAKIMEEMSNGMVY